MVVETKNALNPFRHVINWKTFLSLKTHAKFLIFNV